MKQVDTKKKLNGHINSYTKLKDDLSREVKLILTKRITKDLINGFSIVNGAKYFVESESQNYLVFQTVFNYFQTFTGTDKSFAWKPKALPEETIKTSVTSSNCFAIKLTFIYRD